MPAIADRVQETTITTGTGTLTLAGAVANFITFSTAFPTGSQVPYAIVDSTNNAWEVGLGTIGAGTLARTKITSSSNAGAAVSFAVGTKNVFCDLSAAAINSGLSLSEKLILNAGYGGF